jgi:hypothetical protein
MNVTTGLRVGSFLNNGPRYAGVLTVNDGGLVNVGGAVYLGSANSAGPLGTGTLNVHGGEVRTTQTLVVTTGAVNLDRGSITSGSQQVGYPYSTDATFNQNGGTNSASTLQVGFGDGRRGTYNLRGGTLTAKVTNAPGGTFNHTGGTLNGEVSNFDLWVASAPAAAGTVAVMADPAPTVTGTFTNQSTGTVRVNGAAARFDGEQFVTPARSSATPAAAASSGSRSARRAASGPSTAPS